jgi:hypothetical protein
MLLKEKLTGLFYISFYRDPIVLLVSPAICRPSGQGIEI